MTVCWSIVPAAVLPDCASWLPLAQRGDSGLCVQKFPTLFTMSTDNNLRPTIANLEAHGFQRCQIAAMVKASPSILSLDYTPGGLQSRKLDFLLRVMERVRTVFSLARLLVESACERCKTLLAAAFAFTLGLGVNPRPLHKGNPRHPQLEQTPLPT